MNELSMLEAKVRKVSFAATNSEIVSGYTHNYYRYPARFPPVFARAVIEAFSKPGDTVIDPFVGGGTTLVEGLVQGRRVVGVDLNPIAVFVSLAKTTPLLKRRLEQVRKFVAQLSEDTPQARDFSVPVRGEREFVNTPWWIRASICGLSERIREIEDRKVRSFLRCALLKTSQWALDCRTTVPTSGDFVQAFRQNAMRMSQEMEEYGAAIRRTFRGDAACVSRYRRVLLRSAVGIDQDSRIPTAWLPARLVVTSPPYPGVHVLYHRWQVRGRKETPAPFAVLNSRDGHGPSYYTLGGRHDAGMRRFFESLTACYRSVAKLLHPDALVVQLVSVTDVNVYLPFFLTALRRAGFEEYGPEELGLGHSIRLWRTVPHRRWYVTSRNHLDSAREVLLFHRLNKTGQTPDSPEQVLARCLF